ncbi:hypothetical protein SDC9_159493 [bioreactor metagenome]|uniref:Glycosyl transferase family 1 domain-containing protein n=1 Tax=bioreactor metagenome TaxID=1076179 RepID=A0A645FCW1_9ZZZZ
MIRELVDKFTGRLLLRVFGLAGSYSYSALLSALELRYIAEGRTQAAEKLWLAQAYPHLAEIEEQWLKDKAVTLPLGLPQSTLINKESWLGQDRRILFVCPRIKSSPAYYGAIYEQFKAAFGEFPHIIAGKQPVPVSDENVAGFVTDQCFHAWLKNCRVMFYHSREPRHLHYHPIEAMAFGMPVIYMKGGMLEKLAEGDQPGACETLDEAKEKVTRALEGDLNFIKAVKLSEKSILNKFKLDHTFPQWEKNFIGKVIQL